MTLGHQLALLALIFMALHACSGDRQLPGQLQRDGSISPREGGVVSSGDVDLSDVADGRCGELDLPVVRVTPRVLFILDRSFSMIESRNWDTVRAAMTEVVDELEWRLAFGLMVFPATGGPTACDEGLNGCSSPNSPIIGCSPGHGREIANAIETMQTCGGTPTAPSVQAAADYFAERLDPTHIPSGRWAPSYVVLATDGAPNCNGDLDGERCRCTAVVGCEWSANNCLDDDRTFTAIEELTAEGIPLFVLGISASAWQDVLDEMALRGGTGRAFMADEPETVFEALVSITEGLTTCEVEIGDPGPAVDPELVNFTIDGETVPMAAEDECSNGWRWVDDQYRRVVFCGTACERLRSGEIDLVRATFGCPTVY